MGCLVIYSLGYAFRWHQIAVFAPAVPILALLLGFWVPESPVYLLRKREMEKANAALRRLYGPSYNIDEELEIIKDNLEQLKTRCAYV